MLWVTGMNRTMSAGSARIVLASRSILECVARSKGLGTALNVIAILTGLTALGVSLLSWHASVQANRASIFDQRFAVYSDAEEFIGFWLRDGHPNLEELRLLVGAWNRSHFLFDKPVTRDLRKLWTDAVECDYARKVMAGQAQGDHAAAVQKVYELTLKHTDLDRLRATFLPHLKIQAGLLDSLLALVPGRRSAPAV